MKFFVNYPNGVQNEISIIRFIQIARQARAIMLSVKVEVSELGNIHFYIDSFDIK